jgi:cytochrome P450
VQTRAVVQEVLRLYPPAFMTSRYASRRDEICGIEVPAGAVILIPFWLPQKPDTVVADAWPVVPVEAGTAWPDHAPMFHLRHR